MKLYRDFQTQTEIDDQYRVSNDPAVLQAALGWYIEHSAAARNDLKCDLGVRYGPTVDEYLDVFPAGKPNAPAMVFIHGGYWVMASPREFSFVARGLVAMGVTTIIPNYSLCPTVTLDEITRQDRAAIAWVYAHAQELGIDRDRIYVSGHSAGGQQTGMMVCTDWAGQYGLPRDVLKGGLPISGLFDLRPFPYSYLQPMLQLTWDCVARQSAMNHIPDGAAPPLVVTVGGAESAEFLRQSADFVAAWRARGHRAEVLDQPGADHFTAIHGFESPSSPLLRAVAKLMRL